MGTWGSGISSNDTYADVYADFFELYNKGLEVAEITQKLIAKYQDINGTDDSNNFWFALAKSQWECKQLELSVFNNVKDIIESGKDLELWKRLDADKKNLNKRKLALDKFLAELSVEREKAKARKKQVIRQPIFAKGDCVTFKLKNDNWGGFVVLEAIHNTPYAYNLIAATDINQSTKPDKKNFEKSHAVILNFGAHNNKPLISWILPIRFKNVSHLFEKVSDIRVDIIYDIKKIGYSFCGDYDIHVIDKTNNQFEQDNFADKSISIKSLTKTNKWKFW